MSMNRMQIGVLGVSVVAFGAAYMLFNSWQAPAPTQVVMQAAPKIETDQVLIAAQDLPMGTAVGDTSVAWQDWPKAAISDQMITKSSGPNVMEDIKGAMTRVGFMRGEPIRHDKLVKGPGGFMAAVLPAGERAVAIKIDNSGDLTAGGFILPNDRVDVLRVYRDDEATKAEGTEVVVTETVLTNVRVLAIGQNVQEENGKKVVAGGNATLELTPDQAALVVLAQHSGNASLHLLLRSLVDSGGATETASDMQGGGKKSGLTIVRYGAAQQAGR
jgi:pilus assembly protein CpaB